ncbi:hypothetical protein L7F22_042657 [Adiantum nelumboides]|nr:hypothetical protein [Adiantum nelumboides]
MNKGLSARKLLWEFEKKYEQLSTTEQHSIRSERVELFVQDVDARLQKSLVQLLEDATRDLGLTLDRKLVLEAVNMIVKCQMQVDKLIVVDSSNTSDEESKDKLTSSKHKLKEPVGMTWSRKDNKIHLKVTDEPLSLNNGQGEMKKLAKKIQHNVALVDAATYGLQMYSKADVEDKQAYGDLWPYALKRARRGKLSQKLTKLWLKRSKKRDEETLGTSKRATKASNRKEEGIPPKPTPEVDMEDALEDKKQGKPRRLSYKLKLDIELATDLKKVIGERILNSKVEMTLGDILGIAKREFHEEIIDIIKRK